jgi:hypothetical protein
MKLEEIHDMWSQDCEIDRTELGHESLRLIKLHSKYLRMFSEENMLLKKMEEERKEYVKLKYDYYRGIIAEEDLKEQGWNPFPLNILKSDVPMYIDSDKDIIKLNLKVALQNEKVDVLEAIIKAIKDRGYQIKNAIEYEKFKVGA